MFSGVILRGKHFWVGSYYCRPTTFTCLNFLENSVLQKLIIINKILASNNLPYLLSLRLITRLASASHVNVVADCRTPYTNASRLGPHCYRYLDALGLEPSSEPTNDMHMKVILGFGKCLWPLVQRRIICIEKPLREDLVYVDHTPTF